MDAKQKIPALTREYLSASIPYYSKALLFDKFVFVSVVIGFVLIFVAEYYPHLFPFPLIVLDLSCSVVPRCNEAVEEMLGYGFEHRALLMQQAYAIGATLILLILLATIPFLPAYYKLGEAMYRLARRRKMQLARDQERASRGERGIILINTVTGFAIAAVFLIAVTLSFGIYWEGKIDGYGEFDDVYRDTPTIASQAIGMYGALYMSLMSMFRAFVCFRSRMPIHAIVQG